MFSRKKGQDKLYQEWIKHGDLSPDAVPQKEPSKRDVSKESYIDEDEDIDTEITPRYKRHQVDRPYSERTPARTPNLLYILLAVGITMLCIGLVLILKVL